MKTAAVCLFAALLAAACGGDDNFSWCYGSNDGRIQARYNSSCPGGEAELPPAAKDGEEEGDAAPLD